MTPAHYNNRANGSGKTRFTERLVEETGMSMPVFRISALNALYRADSTDTLEGSVDVLYEAATERSPFMRSDHHTQFGACDGSAAAR